jgi:hypothetical protein
VRPELLLEIGECNRIRRHAARCRRPGWDERCRVAVNEHPPVVRKIAVAGAEVTILQAVLDSRPQRETNAPDTL